MSRAWGQAVCESLLLLQCRPLCILRDVTLETEAQEEQAESSALHHTNVL